MSVEELAPYLVTKYVEDNSHQDFKSDKTPENRAFWTSPNRMKWEFHNDAIQDCIKWLNEEYIREDEV